jgi:hypothetical protein
VAKGSTAVRNAGGILGVKILGVKAGRGAARPMPNDKILRLRPGYRLDLVGDPCIIILRGPDGAVVARFSRNGDLEEIRRAAEEALKEGD